MYSELCFCMTSSLLGDDTILFMKPIYNFQRLVASFLSSGSLILCLHVISFFRSLSFCRLRAFFIPTTFCHSYHHSFVVGAFGIRMCVTTKESMRFAVTSFESSASSVSWTAFKFSIKYCVRADFDSIDKNRPKIGPSTD